MKKTLTGLALFCLAVAAHALQPYSTGTKLAAADVKVVMAGVEQKLTQAGFNVVGSHLPKGMSGYAALVVTDAGLTDAVKSIGGTAVIAVPIRVGVKADGSVSYENLEYWLRAYLRKDYGKAEAAAKAASARLQEALGGGSAFGGDVKADDLPSYRYMFGMERFDDDKSVLNETKSFDDAVRTVRENLAKGVKGTGKVYELVYPEKKLAVFGVALDDPGTGEGWWVNKIGPDHIAALPWEIFVVDGKIMGLYGRYRTALAWPSLSMGQFMGIASHPDTTREALQQVAGAK